VSNFAPKRTTYGTGDTRWLRNALAAQTADATVTTASFANGHIASDGLVKSGTPLVAPAKGLLRNDLVIKAGEKHLVAVVVGGSPVDRRHLPHALTFDQEAALTAIPFINGTAPTED
jgi:hypothetical protein